MIRDDGTYITTSWGMWIKRVLTRRRYRSLCKPFFDSIRRNSRLRPVSFTLGWHVGVWSSLGINCYLFHGDVIWKVEHTEKNMKSKKRNGLVRNNGHEDNDSRNEATREHFARSSVANGSQNMKRRHYFTKRATWTLKADLRADDAVLNIVSEQYFKRRQSCIRINHMSHESCYFLHSIQTAVLSCYYTNVVTRILYKNVQFYLYPGHPYTMTGISWTLQQLPYSTPTLWRVFLRCIHSEHRILANLLQWLILGKVNEILMTMSRACLQDVDP